MTQLFFGPDGSPLSKPEDVIQFLAKGEKHWKKEYSAYETAYSWFDSNGLPSTIQAILQSDTALAKAELQKAIFEKQTQLDESGRRPSQTDVLAIVNLDTQIGILGIEAKVEESFGPLVAEWNDYSAGKLLRLAGLVERLRLKPSISIGSLRYQLLHRTAATLIEAEHARAREAAMIVQSFSKHLTGFKDFETFALTLGAPVKGPGELSKPIRLGSVNIRLGWTVNQFHTAA